MKLVRWLAWCVIGVQIGWPAVGASPDRAIADPRATAGAADTTPPTVISQRRPVYPLGMRIAEQKGEVTVAFTVEPDGSIANAYVHQSTHPGFDDAAVEAVEGWRFSPGKVDGKPVSTRMMVPIHFDVIGGGERPFRVKRPRKFPAELPEAMQYDQPPELLNYVQPNFPRDALVANEAGEVEVAFVIGPDGRIHQAAAIKSPSPLLAGAALAAVEAFTFKPASRDGKPCLAGVRIELTFSPHGEGHAPVTSETRRVLRRLQKDPAGMAKLSDLDAVPAPRSQRPPDIPLVARAEGFTGEAMIEFVIDRKGVARLPRVVEATHPAFGFAAMQAISTWRFEPPLRGGKPVDVVAQIPVQFQ